MFYKVVNVYTNLIKMSLFVIYLLLMFCRVMTIQVDYIITLSDKDNYMMWRKETI